MAPLLSPLFTLDYGLLKAHFWKQSLGSLLGYWENEEHLQTDWSICIINCVGFKYIKSSRTCNKELSSNNNWINKEEARGGWGMLPINEEHSMMPHELWCSAINLLEKASFTKRAMTSLDFIILSQLSCFSIQQFASAVDNFSFGYNGQRCWAKCRWETIHTDRSKANYS